MRKSVTIFIIAILLAAGVSAGCAGGQEAGTNAEASAETVTDTDAAVSAETATGEATGAETADRSQFAGVYHYYGTYLSEVFVLLEDLEGTSITINEDGTGNLDWGGDDHSGPVREWTVAGNLIHLETDDSTVTGNISDGILIVVVGDPGREFLECYVTDTADTSEMQQMSSEDWAKMVIEKLE